MDKRIDYCGVIVLLHKLLACGTFTRPEAEKIAHRVALATGTDLIISL